MVHFNDPFWLWFLAVIPIIYWFANLRRKTLKHSNIRIHKNISTVSWITFCLAASVYIAFAALIIAMAQPTIFKAIERPVIDARDFMLVIDTSDSMEWGMIDPSIADGFSKSDKPSILTGSRPNNIVKRITAAQLSIEAFLNQRQGDRVGFMIFDMNSYFGWPLTHDLSIIRKRVSGLPTYVGSGTEFDGKNSPISSAIRHFDEMGQAKTKVILMVTDGEGEISDERIETLAESINKRQIKLYVIGIGYKSWSEVPETEDLRILSDRVNGKIIEVMDAGQIQNAFAEISAMESSPVKLGSKLEPYQIAHWFMLLAMVFLTIFGVLTCLITDEL